MKKIPTKVCVADNYKLLFFVARVKEIITFSTAVNNLFNCFPPYVQTEAVIWTWR